MKGGGKGTSVCAAVLWVLPSITFARPYPLPANPNMTVDRALPHMTFCRASWVTSKPLLKQSPLLGLVGLSRCTSLLVALEGRPCASLPVSVLVTGGRRPGTPPVAALAPELQYWHQPSSHALYSGAARPGPGTHRDFSKGNHFCLYDTRRLRHENPDREGTIRAILSARAELR